MKHYLRAILSIILVAFAALLFPFGIVAKIISRLVGNYLFWVFTTVEKWVDEIEREM